MKITSHGNAVIKEQYDGLGIVIPAADIFLVITWGKFSPSALGGQQCISLIGSIPDIL